MDTFCSTEDESRTRSGIDVHPYEEAQGFQRLLDIRYYHVAMLIEKSGKRAAHVYPRLPLLRLVPSIAEAVSAVRIIVSHAEEQQQEQQRRHEERQKQEEREQRPSDDLAEDTAGENDKRSAEEVLPAAINGTKNDKLTIFAVRRAFSGHRAQPRRKARST